MGHVEHLSASGHKIPSVSEVPGIFAHDLSGFEDWICRQEHGVDDRCCTAAKRKFYAESADLGHDIHALREAFLRGETFEEGVPEYQAAVFDNVAQFYKDSGYKPLYIEHQMTGAEVGGTLDGCGTFDVPFWDEERKTIWDRSCEGVVKPTISSLFVEDLKVKSKLDKLHPLQLYGYSLLLKECHGVTADWGLILRVEKNLSKKPARQLKIYYLPFFAEYWEASKKMWHFLND